MPAVSGGHDVQGAEDPARVRWLEEGVSISEEPAVTSETTPYPSNPEAQAHVDLGSAQEVIARQAAR
jgi:hypothetical protein